MTTADSLLLNVEFNECEAYALAELCKRLGWQDAMQMSVTRDECQTMLVACDRVRSALARMGVVVR